MILLDQDTAEVLATAKRTIISSQGQNRLLGQSRQSRDAGQKRLAVRLYAWASGQLHPSSATGRQFHLLQVLPELDSHTSPGVHKARYALGQDVALTELIAAGEPPNGQAKLNLTSGTGSIPEPDDGSRKSFSTEGTARRRVRGSHGEAQACFCRLNLLNEHPLWQ